MCGIVGYIGPKNPVEICLAGLKKVEYRGYDSAGIGGVENGKIEILKEVGKVAELEKKVAQADLHLEVAIAQTRWATHGKVTKANAHPHFDTHRTLALVHNGIIENHETLRRTLQSEGVKFLTETDTEVIAHLISKFYTGDFRKAVQHAVAELQGSYAFAVVHEKHPDQIIAVTEDMPLVVSLGQKEAFICSDPNVYATHTRDVVYLEAGEIAVVQAGQLTLYNGQAEKIDHKVQTIDAQENEISKGQFSHYTLKEIHEQPQSIRNAILSRFIESEGTALFEGLSFETSDLLEVQRILVLGCGTSFHAGVVASYLLEEMARIPVEVEISSEYRYKNPVVSPGTLVIAISQSGETADTLAAVKELKAKGAKILALCNVQGSNLARIADGVLYLRAGLEIGVCSTKAFTSQVVVLALFALMMARMRHLGKAEGQTFLKAVKELPDQIQRILDLTPSIQKIAKKYAHFENFFFLGRHYMFPTALEGALKLKEISYINANGYPAGEMKHGPIALINENCPTVALTANLTTYPKLLSNLMEVKARNGSVIAIAATGSDGLQEIADETIWIPPTLDPLAPILSTIATQLLAFYIALERGADIDHPRNLAKSVTVE